jgi:hypothetical protein
VLDEFIDESLISAGLLVDPFEALLKPLKHW